MFDNVNCERSVANPSYIWGLDLAGYLLYYQFFEKMVQEKKVLLWGAESIYGVTRPERLKKYVFLEILPFSDKNSKQKSSPSVRAPNFT